MSDKAHPKAFISYSWSSPSHEEWVVRLASELRASGVDVVLDKWDLKEGHDAIAFMETMVSDDSVGKVLLIFDRKYVEKTEKRSGGVGTEAQIISPQIYAANRQDKFAAIVTELDSDGIPFVPTYYKSRIYIDMSDELKYSERFEQVLRWVYDRPIAQKPALGAIPAFANSEGINQHMVVTPLQTRAVRSVKEGSVATGPLVEEYFGALYQSIENKKVEKGVGHYDDEIVKAIEGFSTNRAEFVDFSLVTTRYLSGVSLSDTMRGGFEKLLPLMYRPDGVSQYFEWEWDNWKFIVGELYMIAVSAFISAQKFAELEGFLGGEYYFGRGEDFGEAKMVPFTAFNTHLRSLEHRSERLGAGTGSRRTSIHADLLKDRVYGSTLSFAQLMQAEFVLYLRGEMVGPKRWWPKSLLYASRNGPFEIFARSKSTSYFNRIRPLFGVQTGDEFREKIRAVISSDRVPQYGWHTLAVWELSGAELISSTP